MFFLIASTHAPAENLMELLLMIDAAKRASASKIVAVLPYYGYSRQDRVITENDKISCFTAKLIAKLLSSLPIDRIITVDLHTSQMVGFFDKHVFNIDSASYFVDHIERCNSDNMIIVSPDIGATPKSRMFANALQLGYQVPVAIVDKYRPKAGVSEVMNVIGDVSGKNCIIVDDIIDSGGTLCNAAKCLKNLGALSVNSYISHGVFSGEAISKINDSVIDELTITDSIEHGIKLTKKIKTISLADVIAKNVSRLSSNKGL